MASAMTDTTPAPSPVGTRLIDPERLRLSDVSDMDIRYETITDDGHPVVIIDNVYRDPGYVYALAQSLSYRPPSTTHTHGRAEVFLDTSELETLVHDLLAKDWGVAADRVQRPAHSNVWLFHRSMRSDELQRITRRSTPHVDDRSIVAGIIYLTPDEHCRGGTGFYRHRDTGFETCLRGFDPADPGSAGHPTELIEQIERTGVFDRYLDSGRDPEEYAAFWDRLLASIPYEYHLIGSDDTWEMTDMVEMRFNRLVMYPSFILHKPVIDYAWFDDDNLDARRLTQNFWVPLPAATNGS